jgi:hypothetical protein
LISGLKEVVFPLVYANSLDGILSYLPWKHGENVLQGLAVIDMLISLLSIVLPQTAIQVSGFAGISTKCASARLIPQLGVGA